MESMKRTYTTKHEVNQLSHDILGCAIEVHRTLGAGLLESIYEKCMLFELRSRGLEVRSQQTIPLVYKGMDLESDLRCDLLVEDMIVVELKAVEKILPIHEAQLMTYLKLLDLPKGIIINFNVTNIMGYGQKTFVTERYGRLPKGY